MERRKFYTVICIATLAILLISNFCFAKYSGGDGTSANPYQIANPNDLIVLGNTPADYNSCFILVNDINLAGYTFDKAVIASDIGSFCYEFNGISFSGIIDGNGHSIISLAIDANNSGEFIGLFGEIGLGGIVKNLGIEDVNIIGGVSFQVGGMCGRNYGNITNCHSTGNVSGYEDIGGLCGRNENGSITNCYAIGTVSGKNRTGGLCGWNYYGNITGGYSTGSVIGNEKTGGLCGWNWGSITDCYSTNNVSGDYSTGGLCGGNSNIIANCYSTGNVSGDYSTGGLCGYNDDGSITNCYSTGNTSGYEDTGGLCGGSYRGAIKQCYATGTVTGSDHVGGLCGYSDYSTIERCNATGVVTGGYYVGGLVGYSRSIISNCYTTGSVVSSPSPSELYYSSCTGGLVGEQASGSVTSCYSTGSVAVSFGENFVGGLIGYQMGSSITNCRSTSDVIVSSSTNTYAGGLVGYQYSGDMTNCYSAGTVNDACSLYDSYVGGLVGDCCGHVTNCYSTGDVAASSATYSYVGGLAGSNGGNIVSSYFLETAGPDNGYGEPMTDEKMRQQANFIDWDFSYRDGDEAEWFMAFDGYPILTWQISDADIYTDGKNNFKDFTVFANYWMREDCTIYNYYCEFADMDFDHDVDVDDLAELMSYWLEEGIYQ